MAANVILPPFLTTSWWQPKNYQESNKSGSDFPRRGMSIINTVINKTLYVIWVNNRQLEFIDLITGLGWLIIVGVLITIDRFSEFTLASGKCRRTACLMWTGEEHAIFSFLHLSWWRSSINSINSSCHQKGENKNYGIKKFHVHKNYNNVILFMLWNSFIDYMLPNF